jgi:hypothetical protein
MAIDNAHALQRFKRQAALVCIEPACQSAPPGHAVQAPHHHVHQHRQAVYQVELLEHKAHFGTDPADVGGDAAVTLNALAIDINL